MASGVHLHLPGDPPGAPDAPGDGGAQTWRPGDTVGGYRILKLLARGGMGEIHLAERLVPGDGGRYRVLKRLIGATQGIPEQAQMFRGEAQLAALLRHDNIVRVFEVGEWSGTYFIAMEYLHGADVGAILRELLQKGRKLPIEHALHIGLRAAAAMHHAHELVGDGGQPLQIVHRDVSPQNLFVTFQGGVKLLDFGVARSARHDRETTTRSMKGKIAYMSPEQCLSRPLDRRSDVFSLGVILYELTLGTRLFRGNSDYELMQQIVQGQVVPPRTLDPAYPAALEAVVVRALQKPLEKRYQTAEEMRADLAAVVEAEHLDVTSEALRRLMRETFGDLPEAWRNLDEPSPSRRPSLPPGTEPPRKTVQMPAPRPSALRPVGTRVGMAPPPPSLSSVPAAPPAAAPAGPAARSTPTGAVPAARSLPPDARHSAVTVAPDPGPSDGVPRPVELEVTRIGPAPSRPTVARVPVRNVERRSHTEQMAPLPRPAPTLAGPPSWMRYPALVVLFLGVAGATFVATRAARARLREPPPVVSEPVPMQAAPAAPLAAAPVVPLAHPAPRPGEAPQPRAGGTGTLEVLASRHHALFKLDGKRVGSSAPLTLRGLEAGKEHLLEAALRPRGPWARQRFLLQPDQTITVRLDLDKGVATPSPPAPTAAPRPPAAPPTLLARSAPTGTLRVFTRAPASVLIDGEKFGATPVLAKLPAGAHKVVLVSPGRTRIVDVLVRPDKIATVELDLK